MKQQVRINSQEFQPRNEYLLIKPEDLSAEVTTNSGIVISLGQKSALDRPTSGTVISVGADITDIPVGCFVMWPGTDGLDLTFLDGDFILLRYKSVIGYKK